MSYIQLPMALLIVMNKFNLIYQGIMRNLNILREFFILQIRVQLLKIKF